MDKILQELMSQFGDRELEAVSEKIEIDKSQTINALQGIMPTLLGAMAKNTQTEGGAYSFLTALDKDHDGSILDDVAGFVTRSDDGAGAGILGHLLGDNRNSVESKISEQSGISTAAVGKLFEIAAPLVMGYLGRQKQSQSGFDTGGIGSLLSDLAGKANKESSFELTDIIGMVTGGSGQKNDLGNIAGKVLGKLF